MLTLSVGQPYFRPLCYIREQTPNSDTMCHAMALIVYGPERLGSIAGVYSVVGRMADNKSTTVHTPFIVYSNYYKQLTHNMVALPQQLTSLCLLVSTELYCLSQDTANPFFLHTTMTQLLSTMLNSRLPLSTVTHPHDQTVCPSGLCQGPLISSAPSYRGLEAH